MSGRNLVVRSEPDRFSGAGPNDHTHGDPDRLVAYCPGCVARVRRERWAHAPECRVDWEAVVPHYVAMLGGKQIRWTFTTTERVPEDVTPDELEDLELRCDIGAAMCETMPATPEDMVMAVVGGAQCYVRKVHRPAPQPTPIETLPLFEVTP